jgi:hypothetical protein
VEMRAGVRWRCVRVCGGDACGCAVEMRAGVRWRCVRVCGGDACGGAVEMCAGMRWIGLPLAPDPGRRAAAALVLPSLLSAEMEIRQIVMEVLFRISIVLHWSGCCLPAQAPNCSLPCILLTSRI